MNTVFEAHTIQAKATHTQQQQQQQKRVSVVVVVVGGARQLPPLQEPAA